MRPEQWRIIQQCTSGQAPDRLPVSLIVDSPWIPGYLGLSTLDYLSIPKVWFEANRRIMQDFPEAIFLPGFWVEMGMAAEPSGFGCRVRFFEDKTPQVLPLFRDLQAVENLTCPDPRQDGLMPLILNWYKRLEPRIQAAGCQVKIVAARGPLATATHLVGVTEFLLGLKLEPGLTHRLLQITTNLVLDWLQAQAEALSSVEGILLLDDIVGFLSPGDFQEFAHPYLEKIFSAFPGQLKIFHNDMHNPASYPYLDTLGVDIFNFTHMLGLDVARRRVGPKVCLMGNVAPLDVLARGSAQQVAESAAECRRVYPHRQGLILSAGGGVSPGTPAENIRALLAAAQGLW